MRLLRYPDKLACYSLQYQIDDDFFEYVDTQRWTKTVTGTGATAGVVANTFGGVLALVSGTVANNSSVVAATNANFKFLKNQPWSCEFDVQFAQANTNNAAVAVGLSSVVTNVMLQDTTGVPATSFSGALIYSALGSTNWNAITSVGTTQSQTAAQQTAAGTTNGVYSNGYVLLRLEGRDVDGTNMEVTYFVDNQPLLDTTALHRPIKHTLAMTSAAAMKVVMFLKGGSTTSETCNVDFVSAMQRRG